MENAAGIWGSGAQQAHLKFTDYSLEDSKIWLSTRTYKLFVDRLKGRQEIDLVIARFGRSRVSPSSSTCPSDQRCRLPHRSIPDPLHLAGTETRVSLPPIVNWTRPGAPGPSKYGDSTRARSVVLTPFVLRFSLPQCAPAINTIDFFHDFTVHISG